MPPEKELHYFDRDPRYPSPNRLATSSPWARAVGGRPWERPQTVAGVRQLARAGRHRDRERIAWLWHRHLRRYDDDWYRSVFALAGRPAVTGEITPAYAILDEPDVARIAAVAPDARLLYCLRDPVERAWSAIRHGISRGRTDAATRPAADIIARLDRPGDRRHGDYERTLEVYLRHFGREQLLVCFFDAIAEDPGGLLGDVTRHLGLPPLAVDADALTAPVNRAAAAPMPAVVRRHLTERYAPMVRRLAGRFDGYPRRWLRRLEGTDAPAHDDGAVTPSATAHP